MSLPKVNSPRILRQLESIQKVFQRPIRIVSNKDIPYLAGYNKKGNVVYFDRNFNPFMSWKGKKVDIRPFIAFHEIGEQALMNRFRYRYQQAHHIITHFELELVKAAGIDTRAYTRFLHPQIKGIYHEKLKKIPKDLDLRPYKDEHERTILTSLMQGTDIRTFTRRVSPPHFKRRH